MREHMRRRLADLEAEYAAGGRMLADLDARRAEVQQTMLRISGAVQVLTELLGSETEGIEPVPAGLAGG